MGRILAIAGLAFVESARKKIYLVLFLYVVALVAGTWAAPDVETVGIGQGRLAFVEGFAFQAIFVFSAVSAVFLAAVHIPKDISDRTIFTVLTKPVSRLEFVAGKMLGLTGVAVLLVAVMGAFAYGYFVVSARRSTPPRTLVAYREVEARSVGFYFGAVSPPTPVAIEREPGADFTLIRDTQNVLTVFHFEGLDRSRLYTAAQWAEDDPSAPVNVAGRPPRRKGLPASEPGAPVVRVTVETSGMGTTEAEMRLIFSNPESGSAAEPVSVKARGSRSFLVAAPADLIDSRGRLDVRAAYDAPRVTIRMNRSGVTVLRPPASFAFNYIVCLGGLAMAMALLVAAAVTFSTFLSGFVAVLAAIVFFSMGYFVETIAIAAEAYEPSSGQIFKSDHHHHGHSHEPPSAPKHFSEMGPGERAETVVRAALANFLGGLRVILPDLNHFNYGADLVNERQVPPARLGRSLWTAGVYVAVLFVVSVVVMLRREVAL